MELTFEKWEDGRWFVVLPDYDGDQEDLEMVDGADAFLDYLTEDGLYVTVDISLEDTEDDAMPRLFKKSSLDAKGLIGSGISSHRWQVLKGLIADQRYFMASMDGWKHTSTLTILY